MHMVRSTWQKYKQSAELDYIHVFLNQIHKSHLTSDEVKTVSSKATAKIALKK